MLLTHKDGEECYGDDDDRFHGFGEDEEGKAKLNKSKKKLMPLSDEDRLLCICTNCKMYLFKLQNLFVQSANTVFVQIPS